jgi:hypothetical protein
LSDLEAELQKLAVDARRTPERVLNAHLLDQRTQICGRPPPIPRFASSVTAKPSPMPAHQRLWPDDLKNLQYRPKPAIKLDEEQAIGR